MGTFTVFSGVFLVSLVLVSIVIAARSRFLPATLHNSRLGWFTLGCYGASIVAAFLIWGSDAEGIGIASMLLGMPWSFISAALLSPLTVYYPQIISPLWQFFVQGLFFVLIAVNCRLAYMLGARIPAIWLTKSKSVA